MSDPKLVIKKLNIVVKYLNFQVSIGAVPRVVSNEIRKFLKEAVGLLNEKEKEATI